MSDRQRADRPKTWQFRKVIPLHVKLQVALRQGLGVKESEINWSHEPALADRRWDEEKQDTVPGQHDPDYIFIRAKSEHDRITYQDNGTGRGDLQMVAHNKRVRRKNAAHLARMETKKTGEPAPPPRLKRLKQPLFPKSMALIEAAIEEFAAPRKRVIPSRPLRSRNDFQRRRP